MNLVVYILVLLPLVFSVCRAQEGLTLEEALSRDLSSGKFTFLLGQWPELHDEDHYRTSLPTARSIQSWIQNDSLFRDLRRYADRPGQLIDSVVSHHLRSRYYLYYVGFDDSPPRDLLFARKPDEQGFAYLGSEDVASDYIMSDWIAPMKIDSGHVIDLAFDVITILANRYPVYIISDADELRRFRRIVTWSEFWSNPATSIKLKQILSSFRLHSLSPVVDSISILGLRPNHGTDDLETLRREVAPPSSSVDSLGCTCVLICTWSPSGGHLVSWKIHFQKDGKLSFTRRTIAKGVGVTFNHL